MILYTYYCDTCSTTFDAMSHVADRVKHECPHCYDTAYQVLTQVNFVLDGTDPGFPGAYDKWARTHEAAGKA